MRGASEAVALMRACPSCLAPGGRSCRNMVTGQVRVVAHEERLRGVSG
jgi:hypothetical protein